VHATRERIQQVVELVDAEALDARELRQRREAAECAAAIEDALCDGDADVVVVNLVAWTGGRRILDRAALRLGAGQRGGTGHAVEELQDQLLRRRRRAFGGEAVADGRNRQAAHGSFTSRVTGIARLDVRFRRAAGAGS